MNKIENAIYQLKQENKSFSECKQGLYSAEMEANNTAIESLESQLVKQVQDNKVATILKMLRSIETDGLAMEECNKAELMDYICEIKKDIQDVIGYIENGD